MILCKTLIYSLLGLICCSFLMVMAQQNVLESHLTFSSQIANMDFIGKNMNASNDSLTNTNIPISSYLFSPVSFDIAISMFMDMTQIDEICLFGLTESPLNVSQLVKQLNDSSVKGVIRYATIIIDGNSNNINGIGNNINMSNSSNTNKDTQLHYANLALFGASKMSVANWTAIGYNISSLTNMALNQMFSNNSSSAMMNKVYFPDKVFPNPYPNTTNIFSIMEINAAWMDPFLNQTVQGTFSGMGANASTVTIDWIKNTNTTVNWYMSMKLKSNILAMKLSSSTPSSLYFVIIEPKGRSLKSLESYICRGDHIAPEIQMALMPQNLKMIGELLIPKINEENVIMIDSNDLVDDGINDNMDDMVYMYQYTSLQLTPWGLTSMVDSKNKTKMNNTDKDMNETTKVPTTSNSINSAGNNTMTSISSNNTMKNNVSSNNTSMISQVKINQPFIYFVMYNNIILMRGKYQGDTNTLESK